MPEAIVGSDSLHVDGNACAGLLAEIFAREMTTSRITCVGCGNTGPLAALHMYAQDMGAVLRCAECARVVLRAVRTPTQLWLDASGARCIVIATTS